MSRAMEKFYNEIVTEVTEAVRAEEQAKSAEAIAKAEAKANQATLEATVNYLKGLIYDFNFTVAQAMNMLKIPEAEQEKYKVLLKKN